MAGSGPGNSALLCYPAALPRRPVFGHPPLPHLPRPAIGRSCSRTAVRIWPVRPALPPASAQSARSWPAPPTATPRRVPRAARRALRTVAPASSQRPLPHAWRAFRARRCPTSARRQAAVSLRSRRHPWWPVRRPVQSRRERRRRERGWRGQSCRPSRSVRTPRLRALPAPPRRAGGQTRSWRRATSLGQPHGSSATWTVSSSWPSARPRGQKRASSPSRT